MKPTEPDIAWCIERREFVNGLLEKRGGWQQGDWYYDEVYERPVLAPSRARARRLGNESIWLPSVGDVLGMLASAYEYPPKYNGLDWDQLEMMFLPGMEVWCARYVDTYSGQQHTAKLAGVQLESEGETTLIALLELLKEVKG